VVQEDCGLTVVPADKSWLPEVFALEPEAPEIVGRMAPWVLRIELDRNLMVDKRLSINMVAQRISEEYEDFLHVVATDDNATELVLRLRILTSSEGKEEGGCLSMSSGHASVAANKCHAASCHADAGEFGTWAVSSVQPHNPQACAQAAYDHI
jgi:hypothetical protein